MTSGEMFHKLSLGSVLIVVLQKTWFARNLETRVIGGCAHGPCSELSARAREAHQRAQPEEGDEVDGGRVEGGLFILR